MNSIAIPIVFTLSFLLPFATLQAGDRKMGMLEAVWESSAGNHGKELIQSFSPDGKLAYFWHSGTVLARDVGTWKRRADVPIEAKAPMRAVDLYQILRKDGSLGARSHLVYVDGAARSSRITFFDPKTEKALATVEAHPVYTQPILAFSPDGRVLASASTDGIILWDAHAYRKVHVLEDGQPHGPGGLLFTPDGKTLAVNSWRQVVFWDVNTGKRKFALGGHIAQVWDVAISPDGKQIASVGNDPQLIFWDPESGLNIGKVPLTTAHLVAPVAFSPDGKRLAVGDRSVVRIFDAGTRQLLLELKGHTSNVQTLAFRRDGKQLASGSGGVRWIRDEPHADRGELILWDLPTGKESHRIQAHRFGVNRVAYSPDGKTLLSGGGTSGRGVIVNIEEADHDRAIGVWASDTGKLVKWLPAEKGYAVTALAFSPDGMMIAHNAAEAGVQLLDALTGKEIRKLHIMNRASAFAFSKDGKRFAVVGGAGGLNIGKGFLQVFDPRSGKLIAQRIAHEQDITCVAFFPDGNTLVTGGSDSALWKWRLRE